MNYWHTYCIYIVSTPPFNHWILIMKTQKKVKSMLLIKAPRNPLTLQRIRLEEAIFKADAIERVKKSKGY